VAQHERLEAAAGGGGGVSTDFTKEIALRLRDGDAITLDVTGTVPSVWVWFEVIDHSDIDLVLDRIVLELRILAGINWTFFGARA
jgi:hypothetical protein